MWKSFSIFFCNQLSCLTSQSTSSTCSSYWVFTLGFLHLYILQRLSCEQIQFQRERWHLMMYDLFQSFKEKPLFYFLKAVVSQRREEERFYVCFFSKVRPGKYKNPWLVHRASQHMSIQSEKMCFPRDWFSL